MSRIARLVPLSLLAVLASGLLFVYASSAHSPEGRADQEEVVTEEEAARPAPTTPLARVHTEPTVLTPDQVEWQEAPPSVPPGAQIAVIEGDPQAQDRLLTFRIRAPADYHVPPHTHPGDERLTVLSGTVRVGHGENPTREEAIELPAGSIFIMPAGHPHAIWVEEDAIVQLQGVSPWGIEYVNPADDPRRAAAR